MTLDGIRDKVRVGGYGFSDHAVKRMIKRSISDAGSIMLIEPCIITFRCNLQDCTSMRFGLRYWKD
jgi:hypothetical protein